LSAPRILVIDDRENVLELMVSILKGAYDVTTMSDSVAAAALVGKERFDLVMTDVKMPGMDGFEVLSAVKRASGDTPVVMMTGFGTIPDAVNAIKGGAFDYVVKPLEAEDVALVVARALAERQGSPSGLDVPAARPGTAASATVDAQFKDAVLAARERASRDYLVALLTEFGGNVTRAASRAGMTRESLHRLLKKHGVRSEAFKPAQENAKRPQ
jgi:DNA-binding NtrC family response regulator